MVCNIVNLLLDAKDYKYLCYVEYVSKNNMLLKEVGYISRYYKKLGRVISVDINSDNITMNLEVSEVFGIDVDKIVSLYCFRYVKAVNVEQSYHKKE